MLIDLPVRVEGIEGIVQYRHNEIQEKRKERKKKVRKKGKKEGRKEGRKEEERGQERSKARKRSRKRVTQCRALCEITLTYITSGTLLVSGGRHLTSFHRQGDQG